MNQLPGKASKKILIIGSSSFLAGKLIKNLSEKNLVICVDKIMQIKKIKMLNIINATSLIQEN